MNSTVDNEGNAIPDGSSPSEMASGNGGITGGDTISHTPETDVKGDVPYERFEAQLKGKKEAEESLRAAQGQLAQTQEAYRMLAQQAVQQATVPQQPQAPAEPDPDEEMVREMLGNDETGKKAYDIIDRLSKKRANDAVVSAQQDMYQTMNAIADQKVASLTAGMQTRNTLGAWKGVGLITSEDEKRITDQMNAMMAQTPQWQNQQDLLLKFVYGDLQTRGEIKGKPGPTGTPLQPGGGAVPSQNPEQDLARDIQGRFNSLRGKDLSSIKKNVGDDLFRVSDDVESEIIRGSYRMEK
jgi:hypothetical protein